MSLSLSSDYVPWAFVVLSLIKEIPKNSNQCSALHFPKISVSRLPHFGLATLKGKIERDIVSLVEAPGKPLHTHVQESSSPLKNP